MMRPPILLLAAVLVLGAVSAGLLWHLGDLKSQRVTTIAQSDAPVPIGGPFTLTDQDGKSRTDADFRGKYMLIFFGYTYCPDVCPTTLAVETAALDKLGEDANKIAPIFVSVDPKRDTPEKLKSYLAAFSPRFIGLTGSDGEVAAAAKAYKVYYKINPAADGNYTVDHSGIIYLMGPDGKFVTHYELDTSPDAMAADLKKHVES